MEEVGQTTQLRAGELIIIVVVLIMWAGEDRNVYWRRIRELQPCCCISGCAEKDSLTSLAMGTHLSVLSFQVWSLSSVASTTSSKTTSQTTTRTKPKTPLSAALLSIQQGGCCAVRYNPPTPSFSSPWVPTPQQRQAGEWSWPLLDLFHWHFMQNHSVIYLNCSSRLHLT